jgi:hypothetical protein
MDVGAFWLQRPAKLPQAVNNRKRVRFIKITGFVDGIPAKIVLSF